MAGDPQNPYTLYFSEDDEPESFPLINAFEFDDKITAMYESYSMFVVETETGKWQIVGDSPDFSVDKIVEGMGCVGRRAAGTDKMIGHAVDRDGMRLWDGSETMKISEPIRDKYEALNKVNIELIHTVVSRGRNALTQFNPDSAGSYASAFQWIYAIDSIQTGFWTEIKTPSAASLDFQSAIEIEDSNGDFFTYAGGADGMVYTIFNPNSKNWVDASGTTYAVTTKFQTPYMRLGALGTETEGVTGRVAPHLMEVRTSGDASTWTVTVETADGTDQTLARGSSTLTMTFGSNNSLIRQAIPYSGTFNPAEYVRLTFENTQKDVFSQILAVRLYFHTTPAQFEVITVDDVTS